MKIRMCETRWVSPLGVRLCLLRKGQVYEVSRYCGGFLLSRGYGVQVN